MQILCDRKQNSIEINKVDEEMTYLPSIEISIEIKDSTFFGCSKGVWIEIKEMNSFIDQLRECEKKRIGCASLKSMSPEDFQLNIASIDSLGHFTVEYLLTKISYNSDQTLIKHQLEGGFNLDSEYFLQMVNDFSSLIPQNII